MIHGGTRRTATATPFVHEEPRRDTENCNCNTFCPRRARPRRATEDHGELQLQHLLSTKGTRQSTKGHGGHGELQLQHLLSTKGHARRTATAHGEPRRTRRTADCNTFCPRRATEDHGELQLQHLLSTRDTENSARPRRPRHGTLQNCNTFCPRRATEGRGELRGDCNTFCPRRDAGDHEENLFLSAVGCEEQLFDPRGAVKERARCLRS